LVLFGIVEEMPGLFHLTSLLVREKKKDFAKCHFAETREGRGGAR
jgi:hypothetical protein